MSPLLRGAALLVMLTFAMQGLSTSAKRLWAPSHHHLAASAPAGHGPRGGHDHGDRQADAEAAAWAQTSTAGRASRFAHRQGFDLGFGHADDRVADPPAAGGSAPSGNGGHQHPTGSGHRHALAQPGVVYVDSGVNPQIPAATAAGFDAYWSIVPPGLQLVLQRLRAAPPMLTQLAHASRSDGPPERPPRS